MAAAAPRVTKAQQERFLDLVRDGHTRPEAADTVGLTGTKMRSLCRRDPAFNAAYEEALAEGRPGLQDRVRAVWHREALEGKNPRLLWYLVVSTLPEAAWFRQGTQPADETGEQRHDLTKLTNDELAQLKAIVAKAKDDDQPARRGLRAV